MEAGPIVLKNTFRGGKRRLRNPTDINARVSWPQWKEMGSVQLCVSRQESFPRISRPPRTGFVPDLLSLFNAFTPPPLPQFISPHCRLRSTPLINQPKEINIRLWLSPLPYGQIEIVVNAFVRTTEMEIVATGGRSNPMQFVARSADNVSMKFSFFSSLFSLSLSLSFF